MHFCSWATIDATISQPQGLWCSPVPGSTLLIAGAGGSKAQWELMPSLTVMSLAVCVWHGRRYVCVD